MFFVASLLLSLLVLNWAITSGRTGIVVVTPPFMMGVVLIMLMTGKPG